MYNPWSVLSYLSRPEDGLGPYWIHTASDDILRELLIERGLVRAPDLEALLAGGTVTRIIDEHVVLRDIRRRADAVWSLLLFSGYLRAVEVRKPFGETEVDLALPNLEVRAAFGRLFSDFLAGGLGERARVRELCAALLSGDTETFGDLLETLIVTVLSYHDVAGRRPEAGYQAFILGMLVLLEPTHEVTSNRESGRGRYDVMVCPRRPGEPGAVLELKVLDERRGETAEQALESALAQLRDRDYAAALRERGAEPVREVGAVFDGKRVWAR